MLFPDPRVAQRGCSLALLGSSTIVVHPTRKAVVDRGFPASQWDSLLDAHDERRTAPIDLRLVSAFLDSRYEDIFLPLWW